MLLSKQMTDTDKFKSNNKQFLRNFLNISDRTGVFYGVHEFLTSVLNVLFILYLLNCELKEWFLMNKKDNSEKKYIFFFFLLYIRFQISIRILSNKSLYTDKHKNILLLFKVTRTKL